MEWIVVIVLFWALPALLLLARNWMAYGVILALLLAAIGYPTYMFFAPQPASGCAYGSCDGQILVYAARALVIPAWLMLAFFATGVAMTLRKPASPA